MTAKEKARIRREALRWVNKARKGMGRKPLGNLPRGKRMNPTRCPIALALTPPSWDPSFRVGSWLGFRWANPSDDEQERRIAAGNAEIKKIAKAWHMRPHKDPTSFNVKPLYLRLPEAIDDFVNLYDEGVI